MFHYDITHVLHKNIPLELLYLLKKGLKIRCVVLKINAYIGTAGSDFVLYYVVIIVYQFYPTLFVLYCLKLIHIRSNKYFI